MSIPPPQNDQNNPPAGWYFDPHGSQDLRWWDGTAWTAHLSRQERGSSPQRAWAVAAVVLALLAVLGVWFASGSSDDANSLPEEEPAPQASPAEGAELALKKEFTTQDYATHVHVRWIREAGEISGRSKPERVFYQDYMSSSKSPIKHEVSCVQSVGSSFDCTHRVEGSRVADETKIEATYDPATGAVVISSEIDGDGAPYP